MRGSSQQIPRAVMLLLGMLAVLLFVQSPAAFAAQDMTKARVTLAGEVFLVDLAETVPQQRLGLGGRKGLKKNEGMLFLYAQKATRSFWMKGMIISIDILWLDNNRIVHIEHRVPPPRPGTPNSALRVYAAPVSANGVLEIAAGRAAQLGLRVGDSARLTFN